MSVSPPPVRLLPLLLGPLTLLTWAGEAAAQSRIQPHHFGRWDVPPRVYGWQLDEDSPSYYGGGRYREYYAYGRGYGYADVPSFVPGNRDVRLLPPRYWPYPHLQWPTAVNYDAYLDNGAACIALTVPDGAEVWLEGQRMTQQGPVRTFVSPPLPPGQAHSYQVRARWPQGTGRIEQIQDVVVRSGQVTHVSFPTTGGLHPVAAPRLAPVPGQ